MWRWVFFWPLLITGDGHGRDGHAWSPDRFVGTERSSITDDADTSCPRYSRSSMVCESVLPPLLPTALLLCTALLVPSPLLPNANMRRDAVRSAAHDTHASRQRSLIASLI